MSTQITISHDQMIKAGWRVETEREPGSYDEGGIWVEGYLMTYYVKEGYRLWSYSPINLCIDYNCNIDLLTETGLLDLEYKLL